MIIVAIVDKYIVHNVHDDYEDGTFEWFDTSELRVEEPIELAGKRFRVNHGDVQPPGSPWREVGTKLHLEIANVFNDRLNTSSNIELFSTGIRIIQDSPGECHETP
ncbi:MAG: hypothetical protein GYA24_24055 [Candidatus Lokiarchaeota archaeon]|nr:hypothetical protein [Candidatus Lokiarchaeota archaeon]